MAETKAQAKARAKKGGFKQANVVKATKKGAGYFIAPHGVDSTSAKQAYADNRAKGKSKAESAKIAHFIEKKKGK